jgi:hypothetical protein
MTIEEQTLINKYAQDLIGLNDLISPFESMDISQKRDTLNELRFLILQSKPTNQDIDLAIKESGLKATYTPCVLLGKGVEQHNLKKIVLLPESELIKVYALFLSLFKIAYKRRFNEERDNPGKWWYWDLSNEDNVRKILSQTFDS